MLQHDNVIYQLKLSFPYSVTKLIIASKQYISNQQMSNSFHDFETIAFHPIAVTRNCDSAVTFHNPNRFRKFDVTESSQKGTLQWKTVKTCSASWMYYRSFAGILPLLFFVDVLSITIFEWKIKNLIINIREKLIVECHREHRWVLKSAEMNECLTHASRLRFGKSAAIYLHTRHRPA